MNKAKWRDPNVSLVKLAAKLAEETGETVQEILNADEEGLTNPETLARVISEAKHVSFMAETIIHRAASQKSRLRSGGRQ